MKNLSSPNVPVVSKKIWRGLLFSIGLGCFLAYGLWYLVALIANKILE